MWPQPINPTLRMSDPAACTGVDAAIDAVIAPPTAADVLVRKSLREFADLALVICLYSRFAYSHAHSCAYSVSVNPILLALPSWIQPTLSMFQFNRCANAGLLQPKVLHYLTRLCENCHSSSAIELASILNALKNADSDLSFEVSSKGLISASCCT